MILVDVNLLVYVVNEDSPFHATAISWWEAQMQSGDVIGLSWNSLYGFLRVATNPKAVPHPLTLGTALKRVDEWLALPQDQVLQPTDAHFTHFKSAMESHTASPKLISDAHFAALAIEHNCELCSTDGDFATFSGLRWRNPLEPTSTAGS